MVWKRYCLLGKWEWPRRVCFEWSWSHMAGICFFKWTLQLEFWSIRGRNFGCNTSCAKNGRKIADTTWFEQIKRSGLAWSYIIRYVATIRDPRNARASCCGLGFVGSGTVRSEILKSHESWHHRTRTAKISWHHPTRTNGRNLAPTRPERCVVPWLRLVTFD